VAGVVPYEHPPGPAPGVPIRRGGGTGKNGQTSVVLTAFGIASLVFMMVMYALEQRGPGFTLGFVAGCALASSYGFLSGAWPFGAVEAVWSAVALNRYRNRRWGANSEG